jgi:hypothetical protein
MMPSESDSHQEKAFEHRSKILLADEVEISLLGLF